MSTVCFQSAASYMRGLVPLGGVKGILESKEKAQREKLYLLLAFWEPEQALSGLQRIKRILVTARCSECLNGSWQVVRKSQGGTENKLLQDIGSCLSLPSQAFHLSAGSSELLLLRWSGCVGTSCLQANTNSSVGPGSLGWELGRGWKGSILEQ